ncbi:MAG TPA: hypothetical protein PLH63_07570 [Candidatus Cloacimonadota bacterium]|nr:hypothetical protein [Candidatus Cloacimonadota bacterium]
MKAIKRIMIVALVVASFSIFACAKKEQPAETTDVEVTEEATQEAPAEETPAEEAPAEAAE